MTVFTIIYNGYGIFLEEWVKHVKKTKPKEIIVVLGKNHGVKTRPSGVTYINCDSDVMGTLRNAAIREITTEWMLYFSVDDELLPNALQDIDYSLDACALKFLDTETNVERSGAVYKVTDLNNWRNTTIPGYIAVKRVFNGEIMYYEDIEIPNYPYLFKLASKGFKMGCTKTLCAIYHRRPGSHGDKSKSEGRFNEFANYIDERAKYYYDQIKGCIVNIDYNDTVLGRKLQRGDILEHEYKGQLTEERKKYLKSIGFITIKE